MYVGIYSEDISLSPEEKGIAYKWRLKKRLNASEKDIHWVNSLDKMFPKE